MSNNSFEINLTVYLDNKLKVLGRSKVVSFDSEMNFILPSKYLLATYFFGLCKLLICACGICLVYACTHVCMCVHTHVCIYVHACAHEYGGQRPGVFLSLFPPYVLRQGLTELRAHPAD